MKLSFSTLACPLWSFTEIFSAAKDLGFDGIEIRGIGREMYAPKIPEFSEKSIAVTMDKFSAAGLEIPIFTSAAYLFDKKNNVKIMQEAYDYIDLAEKAGVRYIRVLGDRDAAPCVDGDVDIYFVIENLKQICEYAKPKEIGVLIETNGIFSDSRLLARFLNQVGYQNAGVLWDIHHTVRFSGETPAQTAAVLGSRIKHIHVKDSVMKDGKLSYKMMGSGDIPIKEAVAEMKKLNYEGYISLEWVKRWAPDLSEAGIALPQFIYYMKSIIA